MKRSSIVDKLKQYPLAWASLAICLLIFVFIISRADVLEAFEIEEADLIARLRLIEGNAVSAKDLESHVESLESSVEQINSRLFNIERRAINTDYLYSFEKNHDVSINAVTPMSGEDAAHKKGGPHEFKIHSTVSYTVSLQAAYADLMEYLYALYRCDAFIRIADFELSGSRAAEGTGDRLDARLRLLVMSKKRGSS